MDGQVSQRRNFSPASSTTAGNISKFQRLKICYFPDPVLDEPVSLKTLKHSLKTGKKGLAVPLWLDTSSEFDVWRALQDILHTLPITSAHCTSSAPLSS